MRTVQFRNLLDSQNALRVRFDLRQGQVVAFVVQLECLFSEGWHPVVRYDTAHNFAHRDILHPFGEVRKESLATRNYNEALTFSIEDLTENWRKYRGRYEQWLQQKT